MKIYRCNTCGKILIVAKEGMGTTICCGKEMERLTPKLEDHDLEEKHLPSIKCMCDKLCVKVGEVEHPHTPDHFIEWIAMETKSGYQLKYLKPEDEPKATFKFSKKCPPVAVYVYCNIHGLWKGTVSC